MTTILLRPTDLQNALQDNQLDRATCIKLSSNLEACPIHMEKASIFPRLARMSSTITPSAVAQEQPAIQSPEYVLMRSIQAHAARPAFHASECILQPIGVY